MIKDTMRIFRQLQALSSNSTPEARDELQRILDALRHYRDPSYPDQRQVIHLLNDRLNIDFRFLSSDSFMKQNIPVLIHLIEELLFLGEYPPYHRQRYIELISVLIAYKNNVRTKLRLQNPPEDSWTAIGFRTPMRVYSRRPLDNEPYLFPICPRCQATMEREYQRFCDRCGQELLWYGYSKAIVLKKRECMS